MIARIALLLVSLFSFAVLARSTAATPTPTLGSLTSPTRLKVLSTVSPITSLVENMGGTRIDLQGIVPEGTNSHTFEPPPSLAAVVSQADLIVANGLFLEEPSIELARANKKPEAVILTLGDKAIARDEWVFDFSFPESEGHPNPHLWTAPHYRGLMQQNMEIMVPALGGNVEVLEGFDPSPVFEGESRAIYPQ